LSHCKGAMSCFRGFTVFLGQSTILFFLGIFLSIVNDYRYDGAHISSACLSSNAGAPCRSHPMGIGISRSSDISAEMPHVFTGEFKQRTCDNGFDCRSCATHAQLTQHKTTNSDDIEVPIHVYGFTMPMDRLYHRGHTWVMSEATGTYKVGLDDFAAHLIGTPDGIELPKLGTHVQVNGSAWCFKKGIQR